MLSVSELTLIIALIATNLAWWIHVRGKNGVISDLQDAVKTTKSTVEQLAPKK